MNKFTESFREFFAPLSSAQKAMFVGLTVAVLTFVGVLFYWSLQPNYTLLFGSLKDESAQEIVEELDNKGVDYQLKNGGKSIYVQSDKVNELRIQLAPMGAPQSAVKGYELFDSKSLGMTDFMQQVNNRRALEGELARSINSLQQVESSRIHLVLPERTPFKQTSVKASASVIVTLEGDELSKKHVEGITSLIAGSVEGLDKTNVTVIDQAGNRLTEGGDRNSEFASGDLQMKLRKETEAYLTQRGQTMLDRVLGPGNSMLRVSVEQDFNSLVRRSNNIDPESRTLISEQRSEEASNNEGRKMVPADEFTPIEQRGNTSVVSTEDNETSSRTRNYEVNKTREVFKKAQGEIEHMSASVIINYKQAIQEKNGEEVRVSEPYSQEKMQEFKEVVSSALGVRPERGDEITIKQVQFWDPTQSPRGNGIGQPVPWSNIFRWVLILAAFAAIAALIYSIRKQYITNQQGLVLGFSDQKFNAPWTSEDALQESKMDDKGVTEKLEESLAEGAPKQLEQKKYAMEDIRDFVELKPAEAAQAVRVMLVSDEED